METGGAFSRWFYRLTRRCAALLFRILSILMLALSSPAERLPIKTYTVGEGLAHNNVKRIFQDAKGFLWVATWEGLSRFDGYGFTNYGTDDGLGHIFINHVTADNTGRLWAATNGGGVSMLLDTPENNQSKKFISFQIAEGGENNTANSVNRILFDAENRLWCATDDGLYRAKSTEVADYKFERIAPGTQPLQTNGCLQDRYGRLWFSVYQVKRTQVIQIADGRTTFYDVRETDTDEAAEIHTIIEDHDGRILAADTKNIFEFVEPVGENERGTWRKLPIPSQAQILALIGASEGGLWIGTGGLLRFHDGRQTLYTTANGLSSNSVTEIFYDREGNLWIGSQGGGLSKLSGESIVSFTIAQGLPAPEVSRIVKDRKNRIYAQVGGCSVVEITGDNRIVPFQDNNEWQGEFCQSSMLLQDVRGNWWFRTKQGLKFSAADELNLPSGKSVLDETGKPLKFAEIYEDAEDNIWLTGIENGKLYRIEKGKPENLSLMVENVPAEFIIRDRRSGTIWLANRGNLWRIRGGKVEKLEKIEGLPILQPRCLFQDSQGRIWIGTRYHGAVVTDEPDANELDFRRLTTADGLASNSVWEIAEDDGGQIYFGTGHGVDRLDFSSGKFHHFTADEGAINSQTVHLLKDFRGNIWASTNNGIMRINPQMIRQNRDAPPIFINQIRIAGEDFPLPETGADDVSSVELTASQNNVAVRFVGLSFQGENALRYEYRLEGVDKDWVAVGGQREVNFANLGAGDYRFEVRAVNAENVKSPQPAAFEFRILRPVYMRWWFLVLASFFITTLIYLLYRNRLRRLLEIERTRTRIATDLHDDIGANLSKISLLSDIVNMQMNDGSAESRRMLTTIAEVSRSSVASMRDIVWAINPQRDSVLEMTRKMRQYAEETFVPKDVTVKFDAPADGANLKLSMDMRRELFLIFKEAINNAARHSQCSQVKIVFSVEHGEIFLQISDDGRGFDAMSDFEGNGLSNMKSRAEKIGGRFEVESERESGTTIKVKI